MNSTRPATALPAIMKMVFVDRGCAPPTIAAVLGDRVVGLSVGAGVVGERVVVGSWVGWRVVGVAVGAGVVGA